MLQSNRRWRPFAGELLQFKTVIAKTLDRLDVIFRKQEPWKLTVQHLFTEQKTKQETTIEELRGVIGEHESPYNQAGSLIQDFNKWRIEITSNPLAGRERREENWHLARPKDLAPGSFSGKDEDWSKWKEDLEDYSEAVRPDAR